MVSPSSTDAAGTEPSTSRLGVDAEFIHTEDNGLKKGLNSRQIKMIGIGGAIGTGLFLGAGGRLAAAGPSLAIVYAVCGFFVYLILKALGELVVYRPSSGSFVSYAREFLGEKAAFTVGWVYWLMWSMSSIAEVTAAAIYINFFKTYIPPIADVPQWVFALGALMLILTLNLLSVKVFGELEFWFSLIKVVALIAFLVVGTGFVILGTPVGDHSAGFSIMADNGGVFPTGVMPALLLVSGVIFAYSGVELIGNTSGETQNPQKIMPKAINAVIFRIGVFYVGSVVLLSCLLPFTAFKEGESPFVTFFGSIGIPGADSIMNMIVLTAALSSLNAGLYSTGRIVRSLSIAGSAPKFGAKLTKSGVPYGGMAFTAILTLLGVALNAVAPSDAFEIVLNVSALCSIVAWAVIVLCQLKLWYWARQGKITRPSFRLFGAPWTGIATLLFLFAVVLLIAFDYPTGTYTVGAALFLIPALSIGWLLARNNIRIIKAATENHEYSSITSSTDE
ncbi:amino acid permease [Paenarthrobacter ureafaciens]|uniref:amino acid permease n=1 Tax=Paenarthrobacter ureafaciens TaxID=37931 RepID=UPI00140DBB5D|nr:amino acid permease [Paenarthrobacter ureafaciens]MCX8453609.1 amino acid permease [Paenarthrobacter ureafaciens]MCY0973268.1 amino acid permease [Paenarthrobacter ureafaciens]